MWDCDHDTTDNFRLFFKGRDRGNQLKVTLPSMATASESTDNAASWKLVKKRTVEHFSDLKELQKRYRLTEYRLPINDLKSSFGLSDVNPFKNI